MQECVSWSSFHWSLFSGFLAPIFPVPATSCVFVSFSVESALFLPFGRLLLQLLNPLAQKGELALIIHRSECPILCPVVQCLPGHTQDLPGLADGDALRAREVASRSIADQFAERRFLEMFWELIALLAQG